MHLISIRLILELTQFNLNNNLCIIHVKYQTVIQKNMKLMQYLISQIQM